MAVDCSQDSASGQAIGSSMSPPESVPRACWQRTNTTYRWRGSTRLRQRRPSHRSGRSPSPDDQYNAAICECALATFHDTRIAVAEMARVLRPGGRLGLTEVTADQQRLPRALAEFAAPISSAAHASTSLDYEALLVLQGLRVTVVEHHKEALERMLLQFDTRTELLWMTNRARAERAGLQFDRVPAVIKAAQDALEDDTLGYALIVAEKPA